MELQRKIIHIDCDCFYAAIEMRDNPKLEGLPVAVGGVGRRGVLATCNYVARKYGIHSAMPTAHALRLCPDLIVLPGRFSAYKEASQQILSIFNQYSEEVEPLSLDEAFLDVSNSPLFRGSATLIAQEIRSVVFKEVGITVSAGIAPNKFLAKIASDWNKPNGQFSIPPEKVISFVSALPIEKIYGVGKVTAAKLQQKGLYLCSDIQSAGLKAMLDQFGQFGQHLHQLSLGIDNRPVRLSRERKSISVERTFAEDLSTLNICLITVESIYSELLTRLGKLDKSVRFSKLIAKVKFSDFTQTTVETSGTQPSIQEFKALLEQGWLRKGKPVRLIGLGMKIHQQEDSNQLELFSDLPSLPVKNLAQIPAKSLPQRVQ